MRFVRHAFEWGYGYAIIALCVGLAYLPFTPEVYAGSFMSATKLVNMAKSDDRSLRALAAGYVAAIHDEYSGQDFGEPTCFAVPQSVDMQDMADRAIHFVDWFAHELKGWPKDKDVGYPARELVYLGLIRHFPCDSI
jgi:hypothetical protein